VCGSMGQWFAWGTIGGPWEGLESECSGCWGEHRGSGGEGCMVVVHGNGRLLHYCWNKVGWSGYAGRAVRGVGWELVRLPVPEQGMMPMEGVWDPESVVALFVVE